MGASAECRAVVPALGAPMTKKSGSATSAPRRSSTTLEYHPALWNTLKATVNCYPVAGCATRTWGDARW